MPLPQQPIITTKSHHNCHRHRRRPSPSSGLMTTFSRRPSVWPRASSPSTAPIRCLRHPFRRRLRNTFTITTVCCSESRRHFRRCRRRRRFTHHTHRAQTTTIISISITIIIIISTVQAPINTASRHSFCAAETPSRLCTAPPLRLSSPTGISSRRPFYHSYQTPLILSLDEMSCTFSPFCSRIRVIATKHW